MRLDDKGLMFSSLFQLSNVVAEGVVLPWQYPRPRNKVILLLVNSTHPAGGCKVRHIFFTLTPSCALVITYFCILRASESLRHISPIPGKWLIRCKVRAKRNVSFQ